MTILKESPQAFIDLMEVQQQRLFVTYGITEVRDAFVFVLLDCV